MKIFRVVFVLEDHAWIVEIEITEPIELFKVHVLLLFVSDAVQEVLNDLSTNDVLHHLLPNAQQLRYRHFFLLADSAGLMECEFDLDPSPEHAHYLCFHAFLVQAVDDPQHCYYHWVIVIQVFIVDFA